MSHRFRIRRVLSGAFRVAVTVLLVTSFAEFAAALSPDNQDRDGDKGIETPAGENERTEAIRVVYDPETGEVVSVPAREPGILSETLARALTRSAEGLRVFELENGGKGVHLGGRYQHAYMVRIGPDGSFETFCTEHSHGAEEFLKSRSSGVTPEPRNK